MPEISLQQAFEQAVAHHREGRLREAEPLYRAVLAQLPDHFDSLRLLGILAFQAGHGQAGVDLIRRAIGVSPGSRDAYAALGQVLAGLGRLQESAAAFGQARAIDPNSPDLCNDLGNVLLGMGRLDEANALYREALAARPNFPEALSNLAGSLMKGGRNDEAIEACRRALSLRPDFIQPRFNLGVALRQAGRFDESITTLRQVLASEPRFLDAALNLAEAMRLAGRSDEAVAVAEEALRKHPNAPTAHNAVGVMRMSRPDFPGAAEAFREAIRLQPEFAEAHYNLGSALNEMQQEELALAAFREALRLTPDMVQAWNNMGNALLNIGRYDESVAAQRRAIALKPDQAAAHFNLGVALLTQGNLQEGFREFEWRWQTPELSLSKRRFPQPRWNGERLDGGSTALTTGKTILLHAEQGFGDTIQFVRYVPRVVQSGARVVLACQPELTRLVGQIPGITEVVTGQRGLPYFDIHCALMSLPLVLETTLETIPANVPYLRALPEQSARWRERLEPYRDRLKIGLAWAGRATHSHDRRRSIPLASFAPLAASTRAVFVTLQKGNGADQAANVPAGMELIDWTSELADFADTAALVDNLDLVITVDTAAAHLAGAMGKTVWVLLPFAPDWRWMLGREDSPWYPTMRLFRQSQMGDWLPPIKRAAEALAQVISG